MTILSDRIHRAKQYYNERRLVRAEVRRWSNDPTVSFTNVAPEHHDAPHGVNTPEEMIVDAEPGTD